MSLVGEVLSVFAEQNCVGTALFGEVCDACNGGGINFVLMYIIEVMIIGIGILAIIGLSVFGIQYLTAGSNSSQTTKAKGRLRNMIIGLVLYIVLIAGLQFLMPGGIKGLAVTTADSCPEKKTTSISVVEPPTQEDDPWGGGSSGGGSSGGEVEPVAPDEILEIHFVGVGGAYDDVIVFRSKDGVMLVDGGTAGNLNKKTGTRSRVNEIYNYLKKLNINRVDYMIGSHLHENHVGAHEFLIDYDDLTFGPAYYPVLPDDCDQKKATNSVPEKLCNYGAKTALINAKNKGLNIQAKSPGSSFNMGKMQVFFIGTREEDFPTSFGSYNANKTSLVNYIRYGSKTFLLTGDLTNIGKNLAHIEEDAGKFFGINSLKVDVVKWPHHGNSSPSEDFWRKTNPSHIVVPNWNSKYPSTENMRKVKRLLPDVAIHKVSDCKYTVLVTDGSELDVVCDAEPGRWLKGGEFKNGKWKFL